MVFKKGLMLMWSVSNRDLQDFPKDEDDLCRRLKEIEELIPQSPRNDILFAKKAFTLFKDCGLITPESVLLLCSCWEGVLPMVTLNDCHSNMTVRCTGITAYISDRWHKDEYKRRFFEELSLWVRDTCESEWENRSAIVWTKPLTWTVSDTDARDFPKNKDVLDNRLKEIAELIPQPPKKIRGNNVEFAQKVFTLLKDCGLITEKIIKALNDPRWCDETFKLKLNHLGGVLRREDLFIRDEKGKLYYYPTRAVICKLTTYYISKEWFSGEGHGAPTKSVFFDWLSKRTRSVCKKAWAE